MSVRPGEGRALRAHGLPPGEITSLSLQRLRQAADPATLPPEPAATVALRMAYAAGDPDLLRDIVIAPDAVERAAAALGRGAPVVCDVAMVAAGVQSIAQRGGSPILCAQDATNGAQPQIAAATRDALRDSTRTAQGLLALAEHWANAVVVIGNAPTALLALLDALADGVPSPAALVATPCGLVAAGEAKQLLVDTAPVPFVTVRGTRGGSAVAAAAVNACVLLSGAEVAR